MDYNIFSLMKDFHEFSRHNGERMNTSHHALFFWLVGKANSLGWPSTFRVPSDEAMHCLGILSYKTYNNALRDLVEFGAIEMVEKSKNQYTANKVCFGKICLGTYQSNSKSIDQSTGQAKTKQSEYNKTKETKKTKKLLNSSSAKNDEDDLKNSSFFKKNGGLEVVENNRTATAPHTGARQTSVVVDKLFCDSELADFETFKRYVESVAELANAGYYFTKVSAWQTKEGFPKRGNWYSVVSKFILDDYSKGKLITNEHKGYEQQHNPEQKSQSRIEFERMRDEYLNSL